MADRDVWWMKSPEIVHIDDCDCVDCRRPDRNDDDFDPFSTCGAIHDAFKLRRPRKFSDKRSKSSRQKKPKAQILKSVPKDDDSIPRPPFKKSPSRKAGRVSLKRTIINDIFQEENGLDDSRDCVAE
jgi:hypothetical protein